MTQWLPIPPELQRNPELAALAILDYTLDITCYALYAEHPDIHNHQATFGPLKPLLSVIIAEEIMNLTVQLQESIHQYKQRLEEEEKEEDKYKDLPF